jgi:signal transduction histidine kinase/HAMP domain-containing protein
MVRLKPSSATAGKSKPLSRKLLLPILGLMFLSLLGSTLAFVISTALTQREILEQQVASEANRVLEALDLRVTNVNAAATLLARDPEVLKVIDNDTREALEILNGRAVVLRNRFDLDLIQIYDADDVPRTNLVLSSLYRESSLLGRVEEGAAAVVPLHGRLLLLRQTPMPGAEGTVVVGLDLSTELERIVTSYRLIADLGLRLDDTTAATREDFPFDVGDGLIRDVYAQHLPLALGSSRLTLILVRPTTDVHRVTTTGIVVMVASTLLTTLLLVGMSVIVTRAITHPIHDLAARARGVAEGDLDTAIELKSATGVLNIGEDDEIGLLADTFDEMVQQLRSLYGSLEAKVSDRTQELAVVADVARAVSSSLELEIILSKSVALIQRHCDFQRVDLYLVESGANLVTLEMTANVEGAQAPGKHAQIPLDTRSLVGLVAVTGKPRIVQEIEPSCMLLTRLPEHPHAGSAAAIPLLNNEGAVGILYLHHSEPELFTQELLNLLVTLADQIATGVQNARLYARQRQTAEHLAEVDRIKTEFLATMSHELRTPLNSIIGFSKVLLKGIDGPITETQAADLRIVHDSGQHLLALISDILDISQMNAGKMKLVFEKVDLQTVAQEALDTTSALVKERPVEIGEEIESDLSPLYGDRRRIRQILLNLLSNAVKFTERGRIILRMRQVEALNPHTEHLEPYVEISVEDSGIGIPPEKMHDIFEEFVQIDGSPTRRAGGTGLGLPITKKLVELHGGRIWVESQPGEGSTFSLILPISGPRQTTPSKQTKVFATEAQGVSYAT